MSYPRTSHLETEGCRDCGGESDPEFLSGGLCPTCDAENYRRNLL